MGNLEDRKPLPQYETEQITRFEAPYQRSDTDMDVKTIRDRPIQESKYDPTTYIFPTPKYAGQFFLQINELIKPNSYKRYNRHFKIHDDFGKVPGFEIEFRGRGTQGGPTLEDGYGARAGAKSSVVADGINLLNTTIIPAATGNGQVMDGLYKIEVLMPQCIRACDAQYASKVDPLHMGGKLYIPLQEKNIASFYTENTSRKVIKVPCDIGNYVHICFDIINEDPRNTRPVALDVLGLTKRGNW